MKIKIETDRLILKTLQVKEAKQVIDYLVRNKNFLAEWEPKRSKNYYSISEQKRIIKLNNKAMKSGNLISLWIHKKDDPKIIGNITFSNIIRGYFLSCFVGFKLDESKINKGYMTEALQAAINYAFDTFKLHRIEANIMPKNLRSIKVVEKLSFKNEGIAKKYLKINDVWEDHIHYVLLNENV